MTSELYSINYFSLLIVSSVFIAVEIIFGTSPASAGNIKVFVSFAKLLNDSIYFEANSKFAALLPSLCPSFSDIFSIARA